MKHTRYIIHQTAREALISRIADELGKEPGIGFAYLHGSVLDSETVHDIDVGLYVRKPEDERRSGYEAELSSLLTAMARIPVDVRVLNDAPLGFVYHVLRGRLLVCHDDELLSAILEDVARRYLDLAPLLRQGTKDAFAA